MSDKEITYRECRIGFEQDTDPINPREWDNMGHMICFHPQYQLGDRDHGFEVETLKAKLQEPGIVWLPLYLLDHSGLWISTRRFNCDPGGWDTSSVGVIFVDMKEYPGATRECIENILQAEVAEYSQYLEGDVWGWVARDELGKVIDSSWGFFDFEESQCEMTQQAREAIDDYIACREEQRQIKIELAMTQM